MRGTGSRTSCGSSRPVRELCAAFLSCSCVDQRASASPLARIRATTSTLATRAPPMTRSRSCRPSLASSFRSIAATRSTLPERVMEDIMSPRPPCAWWRAMRAARACKSTSSERSRKLAFFNLSFLPRGMIEGNAWTNMRASRYFVCFFFTRAVQRRTTWERWRRGWNGLLRRATWWRR